MKTNVKNALRRRGLARSFKNFKYRWWSKRWGNWLFYNPLDGDWYSYAPQTDAFIPADYLAYDPPDAYEDPEDVTGLPPLAMVSPLLPPGDPDVDEPDDPDDVPPDLPGVSNNDLNANGCSCGGKDNKEGNNYCSCNVCRCNKEKE